jgi:hypothetical protein
MTIPCKLSKLRSWPILREGFAHAGWHSQLSRAFADADNKHHYSYDKRRHARAGFDPIGLLGMDERKAGLFLEDQIRNPR